MKDIEPDQLQILIYPNPILRKRAKEIKGITSEVSAVAQRMLDLMHEAEGVGLAAPQVGLSIRMFVANALGDDEIDRVYINPTLCDPAGELVAAEEGCLSIPDVVGEIRRPSQITIKATDLDGKRFTLTSDTLLARVWQHEYDHLEGRLILDRFGQMAKLSNRRIIRDLEKKKKPRLFK